MLDIDRDDAHLIDGFPIEVCKRVRAKKRKIFNDEVSYGYCAAKGKKVSGFQGYLLISMTGIPVLLSLTPEYVVYDSTKSVQVAGIQSRCIPEWSGWQACYSVGEFSDCLKK